MIDRIARVYIAKNYTWNFDEKNVIISKRSYAQGFKTHLKAWLFKKLYKNDDSE